MEQDGQLICKLLTESHSYQLGNGGIDTSHASVFIIDSSKLTIIKN